MAAWDAGLPPGEAVVAALRSWATDALLSPDNASDPALRELTPAVALEAVSPEDLAAAVSPLVAALDSVRGADGSGLAGAVRELRAAEHAASAAAAGPSAASPARSRPRRDPAAGVGFGGDGGGAILGNIAIGDGGKDWLQQGAQLEVHGVEKVPELNGLVGAAVRLQGDRVVVRLPDPHGDKALKPANLKRRTAVARHRDAAELVAAERESLADGQLARGIGAVHRALVALGRDEFDQQRVAIYPEFCLLLACVPPPARALLRNDSLFDVARRSEVYHALLELLSYLSTDRVLAEVLLVNSQHGESNALGELLAGLSQAAAVFLRRSADLQRSLADGDDADCLAAVSVAMSIRDASDRIQQNLAAVRMMRRTVPPIAPAAAAGVPANSVAALKARAAAAGVDVRGVVDKAELMRLVQAAEEQRDAGAQRHSRYVEELSALRFATCDLRDPSGTYRHAHAAKGSGLSGRAMARAIREMSALATGLPCSWGGAAFVRADEARADVMHALIIGPEGTPYAGGAFTFDILLPPEYPSVPPICTLAYTGGVRLNPNLYNCGKVCLSLLGTWQGPAWDPRESTILQVIVSIQSMIMVPDPFFNEPAFADQSGSHRGDILSEGYNQYIRLYTARVGIVDALACPHRAFTDVIAAHFRHKKDELGRQLQEWLGTPSKVPGDGAPRAEYGFPPLPYGAPDAQQYNPQRVLEAGLALLSKV
eukprot:TRINITY_DN65260_c0_g1_i1.p1 TRINITY_DN65260_c0_g1~~TRINITY_DN65260_c0_g1_i1.p1  ORF type:complete len:735 (+),score=225.79 TRINITY_DN65260_c0_g1_i1:71-2206(+)